MAAMTTALTEFSDKENSRTYVTTGHTASKPKLVLQKRKVPQGNSKVTESEISVIHATEDSNGLILPQKVSMVVTVRYPLESDSSDIAAVLAILRDIVAGDEFGTTVTTQNYLS